MNQDISYIFGLLQTDGYLYKRKDRAATSLKIELNIKDKDILLKINNILPSKISYRTRKTNFKDKSETIILSINDQSLRDKFHKLGLPIGKKSSIIATPKTKYSKPDYWRGIIDGDGSLGFTAFGVPFISLTTASEKLKNAYCAYIKSITGFRPCVNRNKRDNIFVITLYSDLAKKIVSVLYNGNICMNRKARIANVF